MANQKFTISNIITSFRFLLLPFIVFFLATDQRLIAFLIMIIALLSDIIDGYIARKLHQETELGRLLDPLCDKISLVVILITLLIINSIPFWAVIIIALRDILILTGSYILFKRKQLVYKSNTLGKATGFLFGAMILAFTLDFQKLGMIILYVSIPVMLGAFITYVNRYVLSIRTGEKKEVTT